MWFSYFHVFLFEGRGGLDGPRFIYGVRKLWFGVTLRLEC